jgi:hypothetical protein
VMENDVERWVVLRKDVDVRRVAEDKMMNLVRVWGILRIEAR